jgi:hypothetical protein
MLFAEQNRRVGRFATAAYRRLAWTAAAAVLLLVALVAGRSGASRPRRAAAAAGSGDQPAAAASTAGRVQPPTRTVTASGLTITNKRKIPVPSATPQAAAAEPTSNAQAQAPGPAPSLPWWKRWTALAAETFWFPMLGKLIRAGARTPLPIVSTADLGRYAWQRPACRQLLRDRPGRLEYVSELIDLAADESTGDWRSPVTRWIKRHASTSEIVRLVQTDLTGPGRTALTDRRLTLLLRLAAHAAAALPDADAREVISLALAKARHEVDPYSANGLALVSRSAVSDLLEQRPELDEVIQRTLELQAGPARMEPRDPLPLEGRLLAIAVRNRSPDAGSALCRAAVKAGLGLAQMEAAARLADAPLQRPAPFREPERTSAPLTAARFIIYSLPWLTPVAVAFITGVATHLSRWAPAHVVISLGDSIALLALLAAVNVLTVQLSAARLPGVVARSAGQPWELFLSYSAILTLLALSAFPAHATWLVAATTWAALAVLGVFAAGMFASMFRLLRRTDAGQAAAGYVARTLPMARAAGRRLGRIQARAVEMHDALRTVPAVRMTLDAVAGEWSKNLAARDRGFFLPSRAGMRRLLARDAFSEGMRLRVITSIGLIAGKGQNIAALLPARDQTITRALASQARRTLRTRSSRRVVEVATGAVALTQMAIDLARAGDTGTAQAVAQTAADFVAEHTIAARRSRTQAYRRQTLRARAAGTGGQRSTALPAQASVRERDTGPVPVVPALRDSLRAAVRGRLEGPEDPFNIPGTIISQLLSSSGQAEGTVTLLTFSVPAADDTEIARPGDAAELLRVAGIRALELNDALAFEQVLGRLDVLSRNAEGTSGASTVTGVLAATACRFDVRLSQRATDRALAQLAAGPAAGASTAELPGRRLVVLWRVGAAGLACGALSPAVHAAHLIYQAEAQDLLAATAGDQELISREALYSSAHGMYLGDQAEDALANFGTFAKDLAPVLA